MAIDAPKEYFCQVIGCCEKATRVYVASVSKRAFIACDIHIEPFLKISEQFGSAIGTVGY